MIYRLPPEPWAETVWVQERVWLLNEDREITETNLWRRDEDPRIWTDGDARAKTWGQLLELGPVTDNLNDFTTPA